MMKGDVSSRPGTPLTRQGSTPGLTLSRTSTSTITPGLLTGKDPKVDKDKLGGVNIYDPTLNHSVEFLFGSLDGAPLVDAIMDWFLDKELTSLPWYFESDDGSKCRTIVRSPLSREIQEKTVTNYMVRMRREGLSQRVAGRPGWATVVVSHES